MIPTSATPIIPPAPIMGMQVLGAMLHQAAWTDVMNKAKRLIQSGQVTILLNRPHHIMAHVRGDHGEYDLEITRTDPASQIIEQWHCGCPWDQFAFDRTRKWKKLEGRPCSHVLAAYWRAKSVPLDIEDQDEDYQVPRGQRMREFSPEEQAAHDQQVNDYYVKQNVPPGGQIPLTEEGADQGIGLDALPRSFSPDDDYQMQAPSIPEMRQQINGPGGQPQVAPEQPANPFTAPKKPRKRPNRRKPGPGQFELFDITAPPGGQPVPPQNPVSIPGANPPGWQNPTNPTQFPGTFSKVAMGMSGELPEDLTLEWEGEPGARHLHPCLRAYSGGETVGELQLKPDDELLVEDYHNFDLSEGDEALDALDARVEAHPGGYVIDWVSVPTFWQRRGIATALLQEARKHYQVDHDWHKMTPAATAWSGHTGSFDHFPPIVSLATSTFVYSSGDDMEVWFKMCQQARVKPVFQLRKTVHLQAKGGKIPRPGAEPIGVSQDGLPQYKMLDLGWDPKTNQRIPANHPAYPNGAPHNDQLYGEVRAGRRGEVTDIEPMLKMVLVQIPINDSGPLHPHLFEGWVSYEDVAPVNGAKDPFRRRR